MKIGTYLFDNQLVKKISVSLNGMFPFYTFRVIFADFLPRITKKGLPIT